MTAGSALSADYGIDSGDVDGLIAAMNDAGANADPENTIRLAPCTYTFTLPDNTFNGSSALPVVGGGKRLRIESSGAILERSDAAGTPDFRFLVLAEPGTALELAGLTLRHGRVGVGQNGGAIYAVDTGGDPTFLTMADCHVIGNEAGEHGGGIIGVRSVMTFLRSEIRDNRAGDSGGGVASAFEGSLTMTDCRISGNVAEGTAGGGVGVETSAPGFGVSATLTNCTIDHNSVPMLGGQGGGVLHQCLVNGSTRQMDLINCTISANNAGGMSGGLHNSAQDIVGGGSVSEARMNLINCTVSGNTAEWAGGFGEFSAQPTCLATMILTNTIVAGNVAAIGPDGRISVPSGIGPDLITNGGNIIGDNSELSSVFPAGLPNGGLDWVGTSSSPLDPVLGPLQDNGGPVFTMSVDATSPAFGQALAAAAPPSDARGGARPALGLPDIGSFEAQAPEPPLITSCPSDAAVGCPCSADPLVTGTIEVHSACTDVVRRHDDVVLGCQLMRTWTVTDACGSATCTQSITLSDDGLPPTLVGVPPDAIVDCGDGPPAVPVVTAIDGCDPDVPVIFTEDVAPGGCPGALVLTRTWIGSDDCGHAVVASQVVTIQDTTPPEIAPGSGGSACLWPPSHRMACFDQAAFAPAITDDCSPSVTWRFVDCTSNQSDDGLGDGHTSDDCKISPDGLHACVRAERQGGMRAGREYLVSAVATDACGNESAAVIIGTITVAHDRREHAACRRGSARRRR